MIGVQLAILYPEVADRDCRRCLEFAYNPDGTEKQFNGQPLARAPSNPAPCRTSTGCPKGTPENPRSLSAKNRQAVSHFDQCSATYSFPDDGIVRQNAELIVWARRAAEATLRQRFENRVIDAILSLRPTPKT